LCYSEPFLCLLTIPLIHLQIAFNMDVASIVPGFRKSILSNDSRGSRAVSMCGVCVNKARAPSLERVLVCLCPAGLQQNPFLKAECFEDQPWRLDCLLMSRMLQNRHCLAYSPTRSRLASMNGFQIAGLPMSNECSRTP
jgi:hypothetical protein